MSLFRRKTQDPVASRISELAQLEDVPTFPELTLRVLERLREPQVDFDHVTEALQWDPSLVTRLLRLVNSAAFASRSPIQDVRHAVTFLGRGTLEQVVVAMAVKGALPNRNAPGFEPRRFWHTASRRAALARALSDELHPTRKAECFTAGLLSDLAVPLLAHSRPEEYGPVLDAWHGRSDALLERLERDVLGFDHAELGGQLGRAWNLPEGLVAAIEYHHSEEAGDADLPPALRLVGVVRETETEHALEALIETARVEYGLVPDRVREIVEEVEAEAEQLAELLR